MRPIDLPNRDLSTKRVVLNLGDLYFGQGNEVIETLLGSCVAVTFWHPQTHVGGMCHFLLPSRRNAVHLSSSEPNTRYGDEALKMMLKHIKHLGMPAEHYVIQVFGGGRIFSIESTQQPIGFSNTEFAVRFLNEHKLCIAHKDINGNGYRYIRLNLNSGTIAIEQGKTQLKRADLPAQRGT
ncbi:chemotaxis protein CheD [Deefgea rivuli]|uniref:chemotaxis protein CheD n=1 Tax=Deefgea rivuli TaxID=400948 RepID=UPI000684BA1F|nr:chemotaxis protein CheD [Deefgea rivuli]